MFTNYFQWNLPLSGAVEQDFEFFEKAGDPEVERLILRDVASYGRQIGILSEIVEALAVQAELPECRQALAKLQRLNREIERRKRPSREQALDQIREILKLHPDLATAL